MAGGSERDSSTFEYPELDGTISERDSSTFEYPELAGTISACERADAVGHPVDHDALVDAAIRHAPPSLHFSK